MKKRRRASYPDPLSRNAALVQLPLKTVVVPTEAQVNFLDEEPDFRVTQVMCSELRWLDKKTKEIEMVIRAVGLGVHLMNEELMELLRGAPYERVYSQEPRHKGRHFVNSSWTLPRGRDLRAKRALLEAGMRTMKRKRAPHGARTLDEDRIVFHYIGSANYIKGGNRNRNSFQLAGNVFGAHRRYDFGGVSKVPMIGEPKSQKEGWMQGSEGPELMMIDRSELVRAVSRKTEQLHEIIADLIDADQRMLDHEELVLANMCYHEGI